jgi:K+-sensing histidine kinase KdpD
VGVAHYLLALVATVLAAGLAWAVSSVLALPNISLVFLAAVLLVAVRSSLGPALACAALSFLPTTSCSSRRTSRSASSAKKTC